MKKSLIKALFYLTVVNTASFILSGYGYQWGIWDLGTGMTLLRYGAYLAIGLLIIQTVLFFFPKESGAKAKTMVIIGFLLALGVSATAAYWFYKARISPPIHDITTDTQSPPEFVELVRLRENAPNPPEYAGEEFARAQREAYPDIQPLVVSASVQEVMDEIVSLIARRGWEIISINRQEGRIEATEKLAWFGFRDDVVLRITDTDEGTRIDMRSKSRIGRGDLGVNANRIEKLMADLRDRI
ncbi:MAG: DUF1499 domain-containing protein [Balneolaceae bacterium]